MKSHFKFDIPRSLEEKINGEVGSYMFSFLSCLIISPTAYVVLHDVYLSFVSNSKFKCLSCMN